MKFFNRAFCAAVALVLIHGPALATQRTPAQLATEIQTSFPDNRVGSITPQVLRNVTQDMVDSFVTLTGLTTTCASHQWMSSVSSVGVVSCTQPFASDISGLAASATIDATNASNITSGTLAAARLPTPTASTVGGVKSFVGVVNQFPWQLNTDGSWTLVQVTAPNVLYAQTTVLTKAALAALPSTYATSVLRLGYTVAGDGPAVIYLPSGSACALNSGNGDGGSQVKSSDNKCWLGQVGATNSGIDPRIFGADSTGATDSLAAINAARDYITYGSNGYTRTGGTVKFGPGRYCVTGSVDQSLKHGLTIEGASNPLGTEIFPCGGTGNFPIFNATGDILHQTGHITIKNIMITCSGRSNSLAHGVKWSYISWGEISNTFTTNCNHGFDLTNMWQVQLNHNRWEGAGAAAHNICLYMGAPTDGSAANNTNNAVLAIDNVCIFPQQWAARLVNANGSYFSQNQWQYGGVYYCDPGVSTFADGSPYSCSFAVFNQDAVDSTVIAKGGTDTAGWLFIKGAANSMGEGVIANGIWAGSVNTYGIAVYNGNGMRFDGFNIDSTLTGVQIVDTTNSFFHGTIREANSASPFTYYAMNISGSSSGSQNNDIRVNVSQTHASPSPSYNGIVESGTYANNRISAGPADCSGLMGLSFGGSPATVAGGSTCSYEINGLTVDQYFYMDTTGLGAGAGGSAATITGLPVNSASGSYAYGSIGPLIGYANMSAIPGPMFYQIAPGTNIANLRYQGATSIGSIIKTNFQISPDSILIGHISYRKQ